jgi:hypothetical protein
MRWIIFLGRNRACRLGRQTHKRELRRDGGAWNIGGTYDKDYRESFRL